MTKVIQTGKDIVRVSTDWLGRELSIEVNRVGFRTTCNSDGALWRHGGAGHG